MNLLGKWLSKLFNFVFSLASSLVRTVLMYALRQIVSIVRFVSPHAFRMILAALRQSLILMMIAILSMFRGMAIVTTLAENWTGAVVDGRGPGIWEREIRIAFRVLAFLTILLGWGMIVFMLAGTLLFFWEYGDWLVSLL